ncbi:tudor domain-containing protein 1 [Cheilinus undulatus]|uniref:tudor domain-containing protein 1 n=1 Tax=Cheilinus undulatus TaxID=241271 RepID=UPI001BD55741|nr:tudor domain-containing protein 1 [Cheilinus undulatus]
MHQFTLSVRPNLPLRKPSTSPMALSTIAPPPRFTIPEATLARQASGATEDGRLSVPVIMDKSGLLGSKPPALTVYFCNYCGQQGNFRCKRCKKTPYCSVGCQTEDWKAHRHMCKAVDPEPANEKPKEITASPVAADRAIPLKTELKHGDAPSIKRVYLRDLHMTKIIKGTDIQASVVEFYSPGRFFLLPQSPELLEALQKISTELQKTYSCPSVTTYAPCVGEVCAVQFSTDMKWYRGLVQSFAADQKTANILYIDFGNEEDVPVERIKPLADNIQPCWPCAMECCVAGVVSAGGKWSRECCMAVTQMLVGKIVKVKLVETLENGRIHTVDIMLSMGMQLSTFLIEHGFATEETQTKPTEQDICAMLNASFENFKKCSDGKDDNTWAKPPEPMTQAVGDAFFVVVTHIDSPSEIIVQKVENAGVIQQLQIELREHCAIVPAPQNFRPAPSTVCCAQFSEDKQWYRAQVLAYSSEERVCIGYLDFGNSEEVDLAYLRPISSSLLALPMQAMPCGLAGVQPVGESWSKDCILALQRRVSNRILRVEIQGAHQGKALVSMIDEASDPQGNVAELLISAGFAASAPIISCSDQQDAGSASATEEPQVPPPACEPLKWSWTELPSDGRAMVLLASVVENPGKFYCHINNPTDHQQLIELSAELKQHCEAGTGPFEAKVGEPCCAMFPGDGAWYRAMVNGLSEDKVSVNFVDYGYSMKLEKKHLRSITPKLLALPFQAVHCWLSGVEPLGSEWSSEALLWFQTRVDGEHLTARVLSVTDHGYGVELESRGQNVGAALISEQLAKAPGEPPTETHPTTGPVATQQEKIDNSKNGATQAPASNQTGAKEQTSEVQTAELPEAPSFPVDWKTVELPLNETFQPYIAAVINPALYYVLVPKQVDQKKLQEVMMELAVYCSNNQASLSSAVLSVPAPGAACCAQFSADNNWYRAVVLEVGENEMSIIYADYGNTEKVPFSRILPISAHLLQLPFQITRCTLSGKEHFPAVWTQDVREMFRNLLQTEVLATIQSFDGSANVLSLTLPTESGGGNIAAIILGALEEQAKMNPTPCITTKPDQTDSSLSVTTSTSAEPNCPESKSVSEIEDTTKTPEPAPRVTVQETNGPTVSVCDPVKKIIGQMEPPCGFESKDPATSTCCCLSLKSKIDHMEEIMQLQLSLIKQLVGQTK